MKKYFRYFLLFLILVAAALTIYFYSSPNNSQKNPYTPFNIQKDNFSSYQNKKSVISLPLTDAKSRITKKPFGIYITPQTSPVQPERFTGYHTGTDFEINPSELNQTVPVSAICDGKILVKQIVSGYGGVIVESCTIAGQNVTVLYGHVNSAAQPTVQVGEDIKSGQQITILADNKSFYTDGERKHLHLGIHKSDAIDYRGYVNAKSQLDGWLDAANYL